MQKRRLEPYSKLPNTRKGTWRGNGQIGTVKKKSRDDKQEIPFPEVISAQASERPGEGFL